MPLRLNDIYANLAGALKTMLGNPAGPGEIDCSSSGFWRSFWALPLALPFDLSTNYREYSAAVTRDAVDSSPDFLPYFLAQEGASIFAYLLSLVALFGLAKLMAIDARFPVAVSTLNWSGLAMTIVSFPVVVITGALANVGSGPENPLVVVLVIALMVVFTLAMYNVIRLSMQISKGHAVLFVFTVSIVEIYSYFLVLNAAGY